MAKVAELSAKVSPSRPRPHPAVSFVIFFFQIDPPDWATAAATYTKCATESLPSNLLKFNVKKYLFNALVCTLASGDVVAAEQDLARFKNLDYSFPGEWRL